MQSAAKVMVAERITEDDYSADGYATITSSNLASHKTTNYFVGQQKSLEELKPKVSITQQLFGIFKRDTAAVVAVTSNINHHSIAASAHKLFTFGTRSKSENKDNLTKKEFVAESSSQPAEEEVIHLCQQLSEDEMEEYLLEHAVVFSSAFHAIQEKIFEQDEKISVLERAIDDQRVDFEDEKKALLSEINGLQANVAQEEYTRALLSSITDKTDREIAKLLADYRENSDVYQVLYERSVEEVDALQDELIFHKKLIKRLKREKAEESKVVELTNKALAQANSSKSQLEEENARLIEELIECKVQYANAVMDLELEVRRSITSKKAVQIYAEQIGMMELKLMQQHQLK
jgi:hypothetical protein